MAENRSPSSGNRGHVRPERPVTFLRNSRSRLTGIGGHVAPEYSVTGPYDFAMLCNVTEKASIVKYPEKKVQIEKVFKECRGLNDKRVMIAHGMWTDDFDGLSVRHFSRNSLTTASYPFKNDEFDRLADKAQELLQRVTNFRGAE
jgi:hypothetical protein